MADDILVQENDIGLQFVVEIDDYNSPGQVIDISGYSNFIIYFKRPDHNTFQVQAKLYSDGTDGLIYYISKPGDLNMRGRWYIQASYTLGNSLIYTSKDSFMCVEDLIEE